MFGYDGLLLRAVIWSVLFFFFQAEDGIRDYKVTGVQTCALPIFVREDRPAVHLAEDADAGALLMRIPTDSAQRGPGQEPVEPVDQGHPMRLAVQPPRLGTVSGGAESAG